MRSRLCVVVPVLIHEVVCNNARCQLKISVIFLHTTFMIHRFNKNYILTTRREEVIIHIGCLK